MLYFNNLVKDQLKGLVYEIAPKDKKTLKQKLYFNQSLLKRILLFIPALLGFILNAPIYFIAKTVTDKYFDNDHYDSVITALLMLAYPLYLGTLLVVCGLLLNWWTALGIFVLAPFLCLGFCAD